MGTTDARREGGARVCRRFRRRFGLWVWGNIDYRIPPVLPRGRVDTFLGSGESVFVDVIIRRQKGREG